MTRRVTIRTALTLTGIGILILGIVFNTRSRPPVLYIRLAPSPESIGSIVAHIGTTRLRFEKIGSDWVVTKASDSTAYRVADEKIKPLLASLAGGFNAVLVTRMGLNQTDLAPYGLENSSAVHVTISTDIDLTLTLGSRDATGTRVFLLHGDAVYSAPLTNFYDALGTEKNWFPESPDPLAS